MHHLIAGAGPAGVTAAETLRRLDPAADITLLCGEEGEPYGRMAIPYLLTGKIDEDGTALRKEVGHWGRLGINLRHDRLVRVEPDADIAELASGDRLPFDRLLIATGARPARPPIPGMDLPGVVSCWTLDDARAIAGRAAPGADVVLLGAGFIGCIILESLVRRGVRLTVLEQGPRMVPRMLDPTAGARLQAHVAGQGVRVRTDTRVVSVQEQDGRLTVHTEQGEALPADLVITATGVRSNTDFLDGAGVATEQGVLVDAHLQSSRPGVYAAGDVAQGPDLLSGARQVHAIQPTAVEHGRTAAVNMARPGSARYPGSLNMNVLDTLGLVSTSFGDWQDGDGRHSLVLDEDDARYLRLTFDDADRLVGVIALGHTAGVGVLRGLIQSRRPLRGWRQRLERSPLAWSEAWLGAVAGAA